MAEERVIRISRPIRSPLKPYTTGETIHGTVHFTSPRTIPFRQVRVWLVGAARTTTIAAMPAGTQTWLILLMREPMACGQWFPMPGESFRAFVKYTMDFSYTIPERIHDACCYGNCTSADDVAERHGRLPPSMGYWHLNDMSPRVAEIIWCISAEEIRESPGSHPTWTMTVQAPIKILPFSPEEPPRLIEPDDSRYKLSRTKKLKENLLPFSRSIGTLKATTSQPPAIMIDPDTFDSLPSCALIDLLFSPAKRPGAPPKIQSVKIEIQACTFYSSRPMHCVPDLGTVQPALGTACIPSEYTTTRTIVTVFPDAPEWKCNQCGQFWRERSPPVSLPPRRPPRSYRTGPTELQPSRQAVVVVGTNQMPQAQGQQQRPTTRLTPYAPPEHLCENGSYEAQLKMLFGVNNHIRTLFLPSFFSCSIARTYTLKLTLNAGPRNRKIKLSVPLQIGVRGIGPYPPGMPQPPFVPNGSFLRHTGLLPADVYSAEPDPPSPERSSLGAASDSSPEASNPESSSSDPSKAGAASPEVSAVDVESP